LGKTFLGLQKFKYYYRLGKLKGTSMSSMVRLQPAVVGISSAVVLISLLLYLR